MIADVEMLITRFLMNDNKLPVILVVDDSPDNLSFMHDMLSDTYKVKVASDGEKALRIAGSEAPPDLILLDIMMPGMNGYEVCQQLKADVKTQDIPVIFVTAKSEIDDEKQGLDLGAVDYITKPVSPAIVLARIRNHLELKNLHDHLAALVKQRTWELEQAYNRLNALDAGSRDYLRTISHELRTPANGVLGIAQLALYEIVDEGLRSQYMELFSISRDRLMTSIDAVLQLANLQADEPVATVPVDLGNIVARAGIALTDSFSVKGLVFDDLQTQPCLVLGNEELLRQSITTLLRAAQRMATTGTRLECRIDVEENLVILRISFEGHPLSQELMNSFFDTFSYHRSCSHVEDLGLAMPLASELVRSMGGSVDLRQTSSGGEIILILLKATQGS